MYQPRDEPKEKCVVLRLPEVCQRMLFAIFCNFLKVGEYCFFDILYFKKELAFIEIIF